jgi:serine/threonine protein kinase
MLSKIIKCLGPPSQQDLANMNIEDQDLSITAVEGSGLSHRLKKLNPECPEEMIALVERMVVYDPLKRIAAADALKLPFLH